MKGLMHNYNKGKQNSLQSKMPKHICIFTMLWRLTLPPYAHPLTNTMSPFFYSSLRTLSFQFFQQYYSSFHNSLLPIYYSVGVRATDLYYIYFYITRVL